MKKYRDSNGRFTKSPNLLNRVDRSIIVCAIISLTILELVALHNGINGTILTLVVGIIAGLAGWVIPVPRYLMN